MDWGWNPDTVAALATALATVAAIAAGILAWRALANERKVVADLAREKHQRQADQVSAWHGPGQTFILRNASDAPIYRARFWLHLAGRDPQYAKWQRIVPPATEPLTIKVKSEAREVWTAWERSRKSKPAPLFEFTFCDARGQWWWRTQHGELKPIDEANALLYRE